MKAVLSPTRLWASAALLLPCAVPPSNAQKDGDGGGGGKAYKKEQSIFAMEYLPIGHLRTDPIISQECLSDHVHTFYGPPKIHPTVTYEELRSEGGGVPPEATSGNVLENQSLYWHPTFYRTDPETGRKGIVEPDWTTIYYSFERGSTTAFPEGFRMIGGPTDGIMPICYRSNGSAVSKEGKGEEGDANEDGLFEKNGKIYDKDGNYYDEDGNVIGNYYDDMDGKGNDGYYEKDGKYYDKDGNYYDENGNYYDKDGNPIHEYDKGTHDEGGDKGGNSSAASGGKRRMADALGEPCEELGVPLVFPTCWDGTSLDSDNHRDHVVYAAGRGGQLDSFGYAPMECPPSHPVVLPEILLFLRFVDHPGGGMELSNGDNGWHADYVFGWERGFLQGILDGCDGVKDVPCGATRLRGINNLETKKESAEWSHMADVLHGNRVPMAETGCITAEAVDGVSVLPRGGCVGEVLSADSCEQPEFPHDLLSVGEGGSDVGEADRSAAAPSLARATGTFLAAAAFLVASATI